MSVHLPGFLRSHPLLEDAFWLAFDAHHGERRRGDTEIDHPVAVAELLHDAGFEDEIVAAALLHDVVEDTTVDLDEIAQGFGDDICILVREMTERSEISEYGARKAEHRQRVARNRHVAAIYAADKLATARSVEDPVRLPPEQLAHYAETLKALGETHHDLPFLDDLRDELLALEAARRSGRKAISGRGDRS